MIAATAIERNLTLLSNNSRDYDDIDGPILKDAEITS
jgi:predicted nucleic acid-binding protein